MARTDESTTERYETCANCGKKFYIPNFREWAYQRKGGSYFCKYTCMTAYDRDDKNHPKFLRFQCSSELKDRIAKVAKRYGVYPSEIVCKAVEKYFSEAESGAEEAEKTE